MCGKVSGIKIHKLQDNVKLIDKNLQNVLESLLKLYRVYVLSTYSDLERTVTKEFASKTLKEYFTYTDRERIRRKINLRDVVYLIELEVSKVCSTTVGDKLSTRHASKGVVSLILPDELRPICQESKEPVDFIYNPFGVFSRMNLSQLLEITCAKPTWYADKLIKQDPNNASKYLQNLNDTIIKYLGDNDYYDRVNQYIKLIDQDQTIKNNFLDSINRNNLYIEVPSFTKIDLRTLLKNAYPKANENLILPKKTINYMQQKFHCFEDLNINNDLVLPNVFVGPIYVQKLYKLVDKLITCRDFGPLKTLSQQPTRGRALKGGSSLGKY